MESPFAQRIHVNRFLFCERHGDELCFACHCDYRLRNNVSVEDELDSGGEIFDVELEQRHSLNAYYFGAQPALDAIDEESYRCAYHKRPDCGECFDWAEIIKAHARTLAERGGWLMSEMLNGIGAAAAAGLQHQQLPKRNLNRVMESLALA